MSTLIDRYVAAATDDFPGSDNATTAREVRAALDDIVEARLAEGMSQDEAERAAVTELGEPKQFADQFRQEPRYLIGPRVFRSWWLALRIAWAALIPLFVALAALDFLADGDGNSARLFGEVLGGAFEGLLQGAFWVTLTFAIIELTGQSSALDEEREEWSPDDLPKVDVGRQITISEVVLSLVSVVGAVFVAVRFQADQLGAFGLDAFYDLPKDTPIFNPELSSWWGIVFIALLVLSLGVSIWAFIRGVWSTDVLLVKLAENGLWLVYLLLLNASGDIINPIIVAESSQKSEWALTGENSNNIIIGIGIIIVLLDVFDAVKGHLEFRKRVTQGIS